MVQAALLLWAASLPYCTSWLYRPDLSQFMRVSKIQAAAQIFTISYEISKIISRLLSVLSLPQNFVYDYCCCPNSAIILTVFKMEAILDFGWGWQNLFIILWGGGGGGEIWAQAGCPCYHIWGGGGEQGEGRVWPCNWLQSTCMQFSLPLLFLISPVWCRGLFRYKKGPHGA
jgi:hypothetical protein